MFQTEHLVYIVNRSISGWLLVLPIDFPLSLQHEKTARLIFVAQFAPSQHVSPRLILTYFLKLRYLCRFVRKLVRKRPKVLFPGPPRFTTASSSIHLLLLLLATRKLASQVYPPLEYKTSPRNAYPTGENPLALHPSPSRSAKRHFIFFFRNTECPPTLLIRPSAVKPFSKALSPQLKLNRNQRRPDLQELHLAPPTRPAH